MMTEQANEYDEGKVILINKPSGWTSFDIVKKLRNITQAKKVGHAGTLDPLATGLLIVCTGKKTRSINIIQDAEKEYTGTFFLGATTPSYDRETEVNAVFDVTGVTEDNIYKAAGTLSGIYMQVPPLHSAVKVQGKRAYKMARQGVEHELSPRPVVISVFDITGIEMPYIKFRIVCSKGTYIRSMAYDFGKKLGGGAYLYDLCRTRIGDYHLSDASDIADFISEKPIRPQ